MSIKIADIARLFIADPEVRALMNRDPDMAAMTDDQVIEMFLLALVSEGKDDKEVAIAVGAAKRVANQIYEMGVAAGRAHPT